MDWREWFEKHGEWFASGTATVVTTEELYQMFKARLMAETVATSDELLAPADLVERGK